MNATKNIILGVMGKVGSGKSTLIKFIKEKYDVKVFYTDEIFKGMQVNNEFGDNILLNSKLFLDKDLQDKIRKEYHPKVFNKIIEEINLIKKKEKYDYIIIETALPSEIFLNTCDKTIYIENSIVEKKKRLISGRDYTETKINNILDSQKYYERYYEKADFKINNDNDKKALSKEIDIILDKIRG